MAKNKKIPKCPPLRFPQFNDKWKQTTLGEIAEIKKGSGLSKDDLSKEGSPVILYGELYTTYKSEVITQIKSRTKANDARLIKSSGGEVIIPCSGETAIDIATARCVMTSGVILGGDLNIMDLKEHNGVFLAYLLNGINKHLIARIAQGSSVVHLYSKELEKLSLSLPSLAEQKKIASFLSLIDERIESCSETIKEIKAQKSCLRTLILNTIIVRWIKLKQAVEQGIINLKRGEVIPKQSQSSENIYPVYSSSVQNKGLMGFHNSYMFDKELISWSIDGGGHLFYRPRHKFNVTNVCGVLETSCFDYVFLCEVLKEQHRKLLFDYQNKAHPSVIQELYQVPMLEISEQKYYGKLFRLLDERIEVEEELLEQYEKQKRYLLRQMFV